MMAFLALMFSSFQSHSIFNHMYLLTEQRTECAENRRKIFEHGIPHTKMHVFNCRNNKKGRRISVLST